MDAKPGAGPSAPPAPGAAGLVAAGAGLLFAFAWAAHLPAWRGQIGRLQALLAIAFAFYGLALARLPRWRHARHAGALVLLVALAARALLVPLPPSLSDDLYRYVWDGRVIAAGHDPYAHAPADPALAALRDADVHPRINHPELRTIYPPLAEAGFALVAAISPTVRAMKLWVVANDLALCALLAWWCARRGGGAADALVYAWNPLVIVEFAGSGHHDPTGMLPLALALVFVTERPVLSAAAFSAAVLVKLAPLVGLPLFLAAWNARARTLAAALIGAGLALFAWRAHGPASGLEAYARTWRDNELIFDALARALGDPAARLAAAALVALVVAVALARGRGALAGTRDGLRAGLLAGPVLHPWYMGWVLALEPLQPSAPWLLLSATALLDYGPLATPADPAGFHLALPWRAWEYGLPLALAVALAAAHRRDSARV